MKPALVKVEITTALPVTIRFRVPRRSGEFIYISTRDHFGPLGSEIEEGDIWHVWMDLDANLQAFKQDMLVDALFYREPINHV